VTKRGTSSQLGSALERLVSRLDHKNGGGYLQSRVAQAWEDIAGPAIRAHTAGTHLRDGELVVYVDSPLWATELSALSEQYKTSMNSTLGQNPVRSVRFTVSRKVKQEKELHAALEESSRTGPVDSRGIGLGRRVRRGDRRQRAARGGAKGHHHRPTVHKGSKGAFRAREATRRLLRAISCGENTLLMVESD
jgi:hypothetical protein